MFAPVSSRLLVVLYHWSTAISHRYPGWIIIYLEATPSNLRSVNAPSYEPHTSFIDAHQLQTSMPAPHLFVPMPLFLPMRNTRAYGNKFFATNKRLDEVSRAVSRRSHFRHLISVAFFITTFPSFLYCQAFQQVAFRPSTSDRFTLSSFVLHLHNFLFGNHKAVYYFIPIIALAY